MESYKDDPRRKGYEADDLFNFQVWDARSEFTLCNVKWDAIYKDVSHFDDTNALNQWIDSKGEIVTLRNASYARVDEPIQIEMPLGRAQKYNYIRVFNDKQPVDGDSPKYLYYFIRGVRHVAPDVTEIVVQLDVWQTFIRQVGFGWAYIDHGHIGIANKDNFRNYGRDFLSIPDGLDLGAAYVNVATRSVNIMDPFQNGSEPTFNVMAISTIDLNADPGTEQAPKNPSAKPNYIQSGIPSGAAMYIWENAKDFMAFMSDYANKPWITAGIVSITLLPPQQRWFKYGFGWGDQKDPKTRARRGYLAPKIRTDLFKKWRESKEILDYIPARYRHLKKFLTAPYCMLELSFNAGSAIVLRPEAWNSRDASIVEMLNVIPPNQRYAAVPLNYNGRNKTKDDGQYYDFTKDGDYLDMALFLSGFPTIPIVNNGQIQYLASNARSIAAQYSGLDWAQEKALRANQVGFDNATTGINAGSALANNAMGQDAASTSAANEFAAQQAINNLFSGAGMGAALGLAGGPLGGAIGGAAGAANGLMGMWNQGLQADQNNRQLGIRMDAGGAARDISAGSSMAIRDANKGLADLAARGDYQNARSTLDARVQDAAMIPHGMSGQFGGETFNLVNDEMNLTLRVKMPDIAAITVIGENWLRYGYPVRRPARIPNDLRVMDKFSYWRMTEVYLETANMPEIYKQTLRGIMEKGFTLWNDPDEIGKIDFADNRPLPDIRLEGYEPPAWEPEPEPEPPVQPTKKRKKKMVVYGTTDGTLKYGIAGGSPGTPANWIDTDSETLKDQYLESLQQENVIMLDSATFYALRDDFLAPVSTFPYTEGA